MKIYFAPMEGITGYIYRNAYDHYYGHGCIDKYFMPFISPSENKGFTSKQINEILPQNNKCDNLVPQVLTNNSGHFIKTARMLSEYGYKEININMGCPSGTVVSKYKGAGFLAQPDKIDEFLYNIFASRTVTDNNIKISIKTRLGLEREEEFENILDVFNRYKLEELIIHPRVRLDYYKNQPHIEAFEKAAAISRNPVGYNGDIFTREDYKEFVLKHKNTGSVMAGRGFIASPWLAVRIRQINADMDDCEFNEADERKKLKEFHDTVYGEYLKIMSGDKNVIHKMKEVWSYMKTSFDNCEKEYKSIKKAQHMYDYEAAVRSVFADCKLIEPARKHFW